MFLIENHAVDWSFSEAGLGKDSAGDLTMKWGVGR
jgi:hypothetical protein